MIPEDTLGMASMIDLEMETELDLGGWPPRHPTELALLAPSLAERIMRLFFPARCVLCDAVLTPKTDLLICDPCRCVLVPEPPAWQRCPDWPEIDAWYSPFPYAGGVEHAIRQMKYNGQPRHAETLAFLVSMAMLEIQDSPPFSAVVPVPMHAHKRSARGYNQAELLAEGVCRILDIPLADRFIGKGRMTRAQNGQTRVERLSAVAGSFAPYREAEFPSPGTLLLVDDVTTTGSTLCACAAAIRTVWRDAGMRPEALRIYALTVAYA